MAQRTLTRHMMVIDDEPTMCSLIHKCLASDYICTEAYSAEQALEVLAQGKTFDLIISDVQLGGLSGIDLLRYVEQRYPETATIIMSGTEKMDTAVAAFRHGAADYLTKPFDVNELHASLERADKRWQHKTRAPSRTNWRGALRPRCSWRRSPHATKRLTDMPTVSSVSACGWRSSYDSTSVLSKTLNLERCSTT